MTKFKHKNLVELHGVCTTIRPVYIVTELMSNGCLLDHLREKKQHFEGHPEILHYMSVQVCSAMCFLEDHGFIHRDLAARNCLVGDHNIVKVYGEPYEGIVSRSTAGGNETHALC